MQNYPTETTPRRILRIHEVEARVGFKKSQIYKLINENRFPPPKRIGLRAVGWDSWEIDAWIDGQLQRSQK